MLTTYWSVFLILAMASIQATPLSLRENSVEDCGRELSACFEQIQARYQGLTEDEVLAKIRNTPLSEHCSELGTAIACATNTLNGDICEELSPERREIMSRFFEKSGNIQNYACTQHFDKFNRNYRCIFTKNTLNNIKPTCSDSGLEILSICDALKNKQQFIDCSTAAFSSSCSQEAGSINRDLMPIILQHFEETTTCEEESKERHLTFLKKYLKYLRR